ncbi:hypothetical protein [Bacillus sp. FJAT-50079]|nr:hypothetical protein [Bacillus sp. FJAT-50079]MBS4207495.1 hypothetical protein [Bacillus sp. FJAT-50079]
MNDIDFNEKGEILVTFKAGEENYVMSLPKWVLKRMLWSQSKKVYAF